MSLLKSRTFFFFDVLLLKLDHLYGFRISPAPSRHDDGHRSSVRWFVYANYARKLNTRIAWLPRPRLINGLFMFHLPFSVRDATRSPGLGGGSAWTAATGCAPSREILVASTPGSRVARAGAVSSDSSSFYGTPSCQQRNAIFR